MWIEEIEASLWHLEKVEVQSSFKFKLPVKDTLDGPAVHLVDSYAEPCAPHRGQEARTSSKATQGPEENPSLCTRSSLCIELGIVEHPRRSMTRQTPPINKLQGDGIFDAVVDRCRAGLTAMDDHGIRGPVRKQTLLRTTSANLVPCREPFMYLSSPSCPDQMIGKSNALKDMQNYEAGFVDKASMAIQRDLEEAWARRQAAAIMVMDDAEVVRNGQHAVEALNRDLIRKVGRPL